MLKRWTSFARGVTSEHQAAGEEKSYELVSGTLDGRLTVAFVDRTGAAVAVELDEDQPQIIRGLAAGAILSDLRDGLDGMGPSGSDFGSAGPQQGAQDQGDIAGDLRRASRSEAAALIEGLPHLSATQRSELKSYLAV